jgi:replicative DNA helicase
MSHAVWKRITKKAEIFRDSNCRTSVEANLDINLLIEKVKSSHEKLPLDLLVINNLQMISGRENSELPRDQEVEEIVRRLKGLAHELNTVIILLACTNKKGYGNRPTYDHIKDSIGIVDIADHVLILQGEQDSEQSYGENQTIAHSLWAIKSNHDYRRQIITDLIYCPYSQTFKNEDEENNA